MSYAIHIDGYILFTNLMTKVCGCGRICCILFTILIAQIGGCGRVFRTSLLCRGGRGIHSAALSLCTIMADSCLDGLAVWCSPGMQETRVRCNNNALNFSVHMNPLLHFAPSYGIHWPIVYLVRSMRNYFPQKGHSCFEGLVVWCLPRVLDTSVRFPIEV